MNEENEFLKELGVQPENGLDKLDTEVEPEIKEETEEETEFKAKNRRERRLMEKNQQLREEAIAATTRAQTLSEISKFQEEAGGDFMKEVDLIYGNDTPEHIAATNILKKALTGMSEQAVQKALERIEERQTKASEAEREEGKKLDTILETVEDDHGIDMSNEAERKGFLTLLEKLSPKDSNGDIIEFADPDSTAEIYLSRKERTSSRAKELASRSTQRSGSSQPSQLEADQNWKQLKEMGIF